MKAIFYRIWLTLVFTLLLLQTVSCSNKSQSSGPHPVSAPQPTPGRQPASYSTNEAASTGEWIPTPSTNGGQYVSAPAPRAGQTGYLVVPVFYATDRKPATSLNEWRRSVRDKGSDYSYYGNTLGNLEMGVCKVVVPANHVVGRLERPSKLKLQFSEAIGRDFIISTLEPLGTNAFFARVDSAIAKSDDKDAFVFVHGFNVKFPEAVMRTAQLSVDLGFQGAPILYSWPCEGSLKGYWTDAETVQLTAADLKAFLSGVVAQTHAKKIHLIAHSMGNRAVAEVLRSFTVEGRTNMFSEVILTAPDINREIFLRDIAPAIPRTAKRVTLYASSADEALLASQKIQSYPRAGEAGAFLVVIKGIATVDVSSIDTDLLGHGYYASCQEVIKDMSDIICMGFPEAKRHLTSFKLDNNEYWKLTRP